MLALIKKPVVGITMAINLLGGCYVFFIHLGPPRGNTSIYFVFYAVTALTLLYCCFSRIHAHSKDTQITLMGLVCSFGVLLLGSVLWSFIGASIALLRELMQHKEILPHLYLLIAGPLALTFWAVLVGTVFAIPFFFINTYLFFYYKKKCVTDKQTQVVGYSKSPSDS